jgi:phosphoribosylamine--glycine ligase
VNNRLHEIEVHWSDEACVAVVLASGGYPGPHETGLPIKGTDEVDDGVLVFHAGTRSDGDALLTGGGRVLTVVARGPDMESARRLAYDNIGCINFEGMHYRRDIGLYGVASAVQ